MSSKQKIIIAVAAVLSVAGLLVAGFFWTHEKVETEVREPPSGEARKNPYLALTRLADRVCCTTYWLRSIDQPDYKTMVTLLADSDRELSPEQVEAWSQWVIDGGHLILPTTNGPASEHAAPLIARLGFTPIELPEDEPDDDDGEEKPGGDEADSEEKADGDADSEEQPADDMAALEWLPEQAERARYAFGGPPFAGLDWAADDADWIAHGHDGGSAVFAASRRVQRGRITVVDSAHIFQNDGIGKGERATLIVDIFELPTDTLVPAEPAVELPTVDIVLFSKRQSWIAYVFGHIWPFFAIMAVILALAIQRGRTRFGPMLADPPEARRSRLEHIDATGRFLWRHGASATLLEAAQEALLDELERHHPGLSKAQPRQRNPAVAELLDVSLDTARELLRPPSGSQNPQSFTRRIRLIEEFRRKL